jgi:transcriptional regulator with XRE-family HTH domain
MTCVGETRPDLPPLGEFLRHKRVERNESARQVSFRAGLSESAVTKIESGRTKEVSLTTFARIANALELNPKEVWILVAFSALQAEVSVTGQQYDHKDPA